MSNKKIVFASIMGAILATSILALNPSTITNAGAQMYGDQYGYDSNYYQDDNRYGYDNNHQKKSSHTDIQKIECVNSNINVNDVDITQIPEDDTATTAATNEQAGPEAANTQNENGFDKINFDRDLVICVNDNANEQVKVTPPPPVELATLSVSKTVSCKTLTQNDELQLVCNAILGSFPQSTITPDEFTIHVTGNNPIPPSFDGSTTPVLLH